MLNHNKLGMSEIHEYFIFTEILGQFQIQTGIIDL